MTNKTSTDIIRRSNIDDTIIGELLEKYPPCKTTNNVIFPTKLEYLTYELNLIKDPIIQTIIEEDGVGVIAVIFYLRNIMCGLGYCMKYDDTIKKQLIREMSFFLYMEATTVESIIDKLISRKYFFVIKNEAIIEGSYLTCIQQVFNYEMYANKKKEQNSRQQAHRNKKKAQEQQYAQPPVQEYDYSGYEENYQDEYYVPQPTYEELAYGITESYPNDNMFNGESYPNDNMFNGESYSNNTYYGYQQAE